MRAIVVCALLMFACSAAFAQSDVTTFILVRHAEKETAAGTDSKNPPLSKEGQERAQRLLTMLEKQKVNVVLSTNFHRTKDTVKPIADAKGVAIQTYESLKNPELEQLIANNKGGTVLISGHSNTIPALANLLLGTSQFSNYEDSDYGNLLIVTVTAVGKGNVTHLRY